MAERKETPADILAAEAPPDEHFEIPPHFNPDESADGSRAVRAMLAEHKRLLDKHSNLMWADRSKVKAPNGYVIPTDKRNKRSGFDGRLPYMGPYLDYYVQNRKVFHGKQKVVPLSEVPVDAVDKKGVPIKLREMVQFSLELMDEQILAADQLRCKVCVEFRGEDQIALMAHFRRRHPKELDALVAGIEALQAEAQAEAEFAQAAVETPDAARTKKRQVFRAST